MDNNWEQESKARDSFEDFIRQDERARILKNIAEMKRWVATIQGVDEYVIRDKDLAALKEKI